jgi:hypothetical protein
VTLSVASAEFLKASVMQLPVSETFSIFFFHKAGSQVGVLMHVMILSAGNKMCVNS